MILIFSIIFFLFAIAVYLILETALWLKARKRMYLAIEFFCRKCNDVFFYKPGVHENYKEFKKEYALIREKRNKWYFNKKRKDTISSFINLYEMMDEFIHEMSKYMGEDHYFAHSEYVSIIEKYSFKEHVEPFLTESFMDIVNKNVSESFLKKEDYLKNLECLYEVPQKHNTIFVKDELENQKEYFDTVLKYPLDKQQRTSIVKTEDNCLVISSAGSGKTSTSVAKIKYLVEKKGILPSRILPLTFTKKAAEELSERLQYEEKGLACHTFHSLAFSILAETNNERPDVCKANIWLICLYHLAETNNKFKEAINKFLTEHASLTQDEFKYDSAQKYYNDRALYGITAPFLDMDGRMIFTRSEEEKKICTFLSMYDVKFRYEEPYFEDTSNRFKRQYKPDFTIYTPNGFIILEHFGIDANSNVPQWFGDGYKGGWYKANQDYNEGIIWKRDINTHYGVPLLETTSAMFHDGTIFESLTAQLKRYNVPMRKLNEEEMFDKLVKRNERMEKSILQLISTFITLTKSNRKKPIDILDKIKEETKNTLFIQRSEFMINEIFEPMYKEYEQALKNKKQIDYTDLILKATDLCNAGKYKKTFDFILVDEFQDISVDRFEFIQSLRSKKPLTKLYAVGDDWQSIFRFSGSDLSLFNDFEKYFGYTEKCKIESTYRFGNPLIKISSAFIMENPMQVKKEIRAARASVNTEISFCSYDENTMDQFSTLTNIVRQYDSKVSIMFIGRYHSDANFIPSQYVNSRNEEGNITSARIDNRIIPYNTVHSAKGLEADVVILVNCSQEGNGFPSRVSDDPILGYVLSKSETYTFAEERRLFYVAITRAKKHCYILYNEKCPSTFVSELNKDTNSLLCPMCRNGALRAVKSGVTPYNKWKLYFCSNYTANCRYKWFVDYSNDNDIIAQYNMLNV